MIGLSDVLAGTGGRLYREPPGGVDTLVFRAVDIDSRRIGPGDLFVAVRGEVHDGHRFVPDAAGRGATGALVAQGRAAEIAAQVPQIALVEVPLADTTAALGSLAAHWRDKFKPHVVGITGSVGKSSTKELAAALLGTRRRVLKNPKSFNNEFGLPLSVLMLDEGTDVAVLEMGTYGPGQLRELCDIAHPTIGIVTNIGHSHLERMGSQAAIAAAKGELIAALPPDGVAILNGDDPLVRAMADLTAARAFTYGLEPGCDLRATDLRTRGLDGLDFTLRQAGGPLRRLEGVPLLGAHSVYTALAAVAIGLAVGLSLDELVQALHRAHTPVRLVVTPTRLGATLIDDSYNASPSSALAALAVLAEAPARRRVAVLGDMLELGSYEDEGHRLVGRQAAKVVDQLLTVGPRARIIADEARLAGLAAGVVRELATKDGLVALLERELREGDTVLIKGSRGLALEDVVAALRASDKRRAMSDAQV